MGIRSEKGLAIAFVYAGLLSNILSGIPERRAEVARGEAMTMLIEGIRAENKRSEEIIEAERKSIRELHDYADRHTTYSNLMLAFGLSGSSVGLYGLLTRSEPERSKRTL